MLDVGNSSLNLYSSYYSIGFQEHLLQKNFLGLTDANSMTYLGMEYSSLKEESVAADPVDRQP